MNSLTHTWRFLTANKSFTLINIAGMTASITCTLMILAYVSFHFSFDRLHDGSARMYRILSVDENTGGVRNVGGMHPAALIPAVRNEIPEVEDATRFFWGEAVTIRIQDRFNELDRVYFAESKFFEFFDFPLLAGQPGDVLEEPNTAVISESYARQLFGDEDPIGKIIRLFNVRDFRITGIMADLPANSHLRVELVGSILPDPNWGERGQGYNDSWQRINMVSYIKLFENSDSESVQNRINQIIENNQVMPGLSARLQRLHDVHLRSTGVVYEVNDNKRSIQEMYVLGAIAFMLMFAAVANYINLTMARSMTRAVEVGIRKTSGATRTRLARQFIGETLALLVLSAALGLVLIEIIEPLFNLTLDQSLLSILIASPSLVLVGSGGLFLVAILAGFYPAFVLSSYQAIDVLRGRFTTNTKGSYLRKSLVLVQFIIAICILIGLLVANNQLNYMKTKPMGFDPTNIILVGLSDTSQFERHAAFSNQLESIPEVESVTSTSAVPGRGGWVKSVFTPVDGPETGEEFIVSNYEVSQQYVETLGLNLMQGRNFQTESISNQENPILINQSAIRLFQWQSSPLGEQLRTSDNTIYTVVGVVEDYHLESLQFEIEPLILTYNDGASWGNAIKVREGTMADAIDKIEAAWEEVYSAYPFEYRIYSEDINGLVMEEQVFASQLFQFAIVAMFIACLGMYGLASFTANEKTKEIGVRKVYGATTFNIFSLVLQEQMLLILLAIFVACPLAYYVVNSWLSGFAFRIELGAWVFVAGSLAALFVGLLTVSVIVLKVARSNPVDALRYE